MITEDGCRLWATGLGLGEPLVMCHGGPGLWDMFGDLAAVLAARLRVVRWFRRSSWTVRTTSGHAGPWTRWREVTRVTLDAGHVPWVEAPEEFCSALLAFLT